MNNKTCVCVCVCLYTYMYKLWVIMCLKVYLYRLSGIVQVVDFNVCIILDRIMASASNFTNMCFLCSTTKSKCFPPNHETEVFVKEEYTITYVYWFNECKPIHVWESYWRHCIKRQGNRWSHDSCNFSVCPSINRLLHLNEITEKARRLLTWNLI
jgi:hypothetical protein